MTTQPPGRPAVTNDKRALIADGHPARHRGPAAGEGAVVIGRLARLARAVVESASEATLLIQGSALVPGSPVAAQRDDNGWPVFWCGLGSAVAAAGAANRSALLTARGTGDLGEDVTVMLTGRLEVIGWSWERGRQIGAIVLAPEQVLVETRAGGDTPERRHEVPVADYANAAPDTLPACAAHLAGHTNTAHARELRQFVAARAGVPADQVASAWLDGLDERGALVRWVDPAGAQAMPAAFPRQARTTTELANPDPALLRTISRHADGLEVCSGGELRHAATETPGRPPAFGGPGKTAAELAAAVRTGALLHVESPQELLLLASIAGEQSASAREAPGSTGRGETAGRRPSGEPGGAGADVLLRANIHVPPPAGAGLVMGGVPRGRSGWIVDLLPSARR